MVPLLLSVSFDEADRGPWPWARSISAPWLKGNECASCGRRVDLEPGGGPGEMKIDSGSKWSDCIGGSGPPHFVVSERVVDSMNLAGITGFEAHAVNIIEVKPTRLRDKPHGQYFYLRAIGTVLIDLQKSGLRHYKQCPECLNVLERSHHKFWEIPIPGSWDGKDFVAIHNMRTARIFCSVRVFELAHKERWTNFRFIPIDANPRHAVHWDGIDYLGDQWPPQWYPDRPSKGKTMDEWLELVRTEDYFFPGHHAVEALMDFGDAAIPPLKELLFHGSELARRNAAHTLLGFKFEDLIVLTPKLKAAIKNELPETDDSLLHQEWVEAGA